MDKKTFLGAAAGLGLVMSIVAASYWNVSQKHTEGAEVVQNDPIYLEGDHYHEQPETNPDLHFENYQLRITDRTISFSSTPTYEQVKKGRYIYYFPYYEEEHTENRVEGYESEKMYIEAYLIDENEKFVKMAENNEKTKHDTDRGVFAYTANKKSDKVVLIVRFVGGTYPKGGLGDQWFKVRKTPKF